MKKTRGSFLFTLLERNLPYQEEISDPEEKVNIWWPLLIVAITIVLIIARIHFLGFPE